MTNYTHIKCVFLRFLNVRKFPWITDFREHKSGKFDPLAMYLHIYLVHVISSVGVFSGLEMLKAKRTVNKIITSESHLNWLIRLFEVISF